LGLESAARADAAIKAIANLTIDFFIGRFLIEVNAYPLVEQNYTDGVAPHKRKERIPFRSPGAD
jgi:hypothetical protein